MNLFRRSLIGLAKRILKHYQVSPDPNGPVCDCSQKDFWWREAHRAFQRWEMAMRRQNWPQCHQARKQFYLARRRFQSEVEGRYL